MHRLRKFWQSAVVLAIAASPLTAFAQGTPRPVVSDFQGIIRILEKFLSWIYTIFFVLAAIIIVFAAFNYLTAGGEEEKVEKAKKQFIYAIVAIAVAIVATSVSFVVKNFFGADIYGPPLP